MANVTVDLGTVGWTSIDLFTPFDYLSFSSWALDPPATIVQTPATFRVPVGGCFRIVAGADSAKPISITGGRIIADAAGSDYYHYTMIVVESSSCFITMGMAS